MKFINRNKELEQLEQEYLRTGSSFVILYGRRRVGKTTLIKEFIRNKPSLYLLADLQNEFVQIERFKKIVSHSFNDSFLINIKLDSIESLFVYIIDKIDSKHKFIIVIDEFQYLVKINSTIPSIFQRLWDELLNNKNIMLILCGSIINMMYDATLSYNSPLYGRRTMQLKLTPISFFDYKYFFKTKDINKLLQFYGITGGVPKYVELLEFTKNIWWNIKEKIINKNTFLYEEPKFLLYESNTESGSYLSILEIIASGEHKIGKIATRLGIQTKNLTSFIEKLMDLEIIEREVPVTESNPAKSKKGLYFIKDNFFNFWFRFVYPNKTYIELGEMEYVLNRIKNNFSLYISFIFEQICREFVAITKKFPFKIKKVGRWWNKKTEIDIVAIGEKEILIGECKYSKNKIGDRVLKDLKRKYSEMNFKDKEKYTVYYVLFSKSGFSEVLHKISQKENLFLITLNDMIT